MEIKRVLLGSPVHQKPEILKEFLECISCLRQDGFGINYFFYDDNDDVESSAMLRHFSAAVGNTVIRGSERQTDYHCDENTHYWNEDLVWKVAAFKDEILDYARENGYDFLFLIDSDILPEPSTVSRLINAGKDIVSAVFWTAWRPGETPLPNVWCYDHYDMAPRSRDEKLTADEIAHRQREFIDMLKEPGIYEVGMLGACTLLSRKALSSGISFKPVYNLSMWGEDRHFCVRAASLGFMMYADTHCKLFHIYRESDLDNVVKFRKEAGISEPAVRLCPYRDARCPVCGSGGIKGFHNYMGFKLLACGACGLKFRPDARSVCIGSLISQTYGPDWVQMREKYSRDTFLRHARFNNLLLELFSPCKGHLLEIGSGTGEFLYMAREAGWNVVGVEPASDACRYAREKFGLELICTTWNEISHKLAPEPAHEHEYESRHTFDAVAFWHVLEHMADPAAFLESASSVLKPDGLLYFSLPNDDSLYNEVYGKASSLYMEPDHLMHFNRRNLSIILEKAGLQQVAMFTRQEPDGLDVVCKALYGMDIPFEKLMGVSAKMQAQSRGYELVCIARRKQPAVKSPSGTG